MHRLLFGIIVPLLIIVTLPAVAQDRQVAFGQSLRLQGSELEVVSDSLEVEQATGTTIFTGNVRVSQGDLRMETETLRLEYEPGARAGTQRVGRLVATGGVVMATSAEAIEAREAVYSMTSQTLEMTGDVVLVQGASLLSGQRFVADLRAGTGRMIGRVRTVIQMD